MLRFFATLKKFPRGNQFNLAVFTQTGRAAFLPILTPVIIIGGILSGVFTPTEAAAIAALYATIIEVFIYKELSWSHLRKILFETLRDSGTIMVICFCASLYGYMVTRSQLAIQVANMISGVSMDPIIVSFIIVGFLLVVGCFMESLAAITILTPVFIPVIVKVGIDPLAFGIIMILTLMIGLLTPPFGIVLFVLSKIGNISLARITKAVFPFLIVLLIAVAAMIFFPDIITWLPRIIMK